MRLADGTLSPVDGLLLVGALLVLFAIGSSKFSSRLGLPTLVAFIGLGMLAGPEGLGGIAFENYALANGIGTVALILILFNGGLRTSVDDLRSAWKPALALATGGVLVTAIVTGAAAAWILGLPLLEGILVGCIVGSTDAAAVFSVLQNQGISLPDRIGPTLEVESGSNDPMAVFLTVSLIEILLGNLDPGIGLVGHFLLVMGFGVAAGLVVGALGAEANDRVRLDAAGLYPLLTATIGFLAYGLAAVVGGSGFLAVYVAGLVLGNSGVVFRRGTFLFSDAMAWLAQIIMFTMLGLLTFPSRLLAVAGAGLTISAVLILVARPLAVATLLPWFRFNARETALIAWIGLRGAIPIILATYPLLAGLPNGQTIFDVVFFVVFLSAILQGWSLPHIASSLALLRDPRPEPPVSLEITSLPHTPGDIVDYLVIEGSLASGRTINDVAFPDGAVVVMVTRGDQVISPRGSTLLMTGDHVFVVIRPTSRALVDRVFASVGTRNDE